MRDDPVEWIADHIAAGIILREEGWWKLVTPELADAWKKRQQQWWDELREGVRSYSRRDFAKVDVVGWVLPKELPIWHPWYEEIPIDVRECGTGSGSKANNPLSRHIALIGNAEAIEREWRKALPATPTAAVAKPGRRPRDMPLSKLGEGWADEMQRQSKRTKIDVARDIAEREGRNPETIVREARKARELRGK